MTDLIGNLCQECLTGHLQLHRGTGRTFEVRKGLSLELPDDLDVPTCDVCHEMSFNGAMLQSVAARLHQEVATLQRKHVGFLIESIKAQAGDCTMREIEHACGVTPTYLSHVQRGTKEASDVLIGLLEAFAIHPEEFHRRRARGLAFDMASVKQAMSERQRQTLTSRVAPTTAPYCAWRVQMAERLRLTWSGDLTVHHGKSSTIVSPDPSPLPHYPTPASQEAELTTAPRDMRGNVYNLTMYVAHPRRKEAEPKWERWSPDHSRVGM